MPVNESVFVCNGCALFLIYLIMLPTEPFRFGTLVLLWSLMVNTSLCNHLWAELSVLVWKLKRLVGIHKLTNKANYMSNYTHVLESTVGY